MVKVGGLYPVWNDPSRRCADCGGRAEGVSRTVDGKDLFIRGSVHGAGRVPRGSRSFFA